MKAVGRISTNGTDVPAPSAEPRSLHALPTETCAGEIEPRTKEDSARSEEREWTPEEVEKLQDLIATHSVPTVAKYLRRTPKAIRSKLLRLGSTADHLAGFKAKDLVNLIKVTPRQIRRWREKGYLESMAGRITEESFERLCTNRPSRIPYDSLDRNTQLWLRDFGYPAVEGFLPKELAAKLKVKRKEIRRWLARCWVRQCQGKITEESFRRFCRTHADAIPYDGLDPEIQKWLRSLGYRASASETSEAA